MRSVSIVGSTGSIGVQAVDVVSAEPERLRVVALGANRSVAALAEQARALRPEVVAIADETLAGELAAAVPKGTEVLAGPASLALIAGRGDVVLNAVVGFAGLPVTLAALEHGRRLALANKESLVAAAPVVQAARARGGEIVPVDSEHCAIHQCLGERRHTGTDWPGNPTPGGRHSGAPASPADVDRLIVTASGGPFRGRRAEDLIGVGVEDALAHPTWKMGPKITIDSSTLMNKGLEVLEAHELFGVDYDDIEVVVHPQSIIHSMVEFSDGTTLAQLSHPDMRLPIAYALTYPERVTRRFGAIDWRELSQLDFESPDLETFACLRLAYAAGREGGSAPTFLNAANEVAVAAFLERRISWLEIATVVEAVLESHDQRPLRSTEDVLAADAEARRLAARAVAGRDRG
ncbi:MAG: 1-deoxy-D-xylulose-5-phosphate reductoisomerase [Actinomycetota bacterium]|nr:1-deoxy-D-xylulose-5-phosphate reductoisomerase [Actinomycetota bacterium]